MTTRTRRQPKTFTVVHYTVEKDAWSKSKAFSSKADAERLRVLYEALGYVALVHDTQALLDIGMPEGAPSAQALAKVAATRSEHARRPRGADDLCSAVEQALWNEIHALLAS